MPSTESARTGLDSTPRRPYKEGILETEDECEVSHSRTSSEGSSDVPNKRELPETRDLVLEKIYLEDDGDLAVNEVSPIGLFFAFKGLKHYNSTPLAAVLYQIDCDRVGNDKYHMSEYYADLPSREASSRDIIAPYAHWEARLPLSSIEILEQENPSFVVIRTISCDWTRSVLFPPEDPELESILLWSPELKDAIHELASYNLNYFRDERRSRRAHYYDLDSLKPHVIEDLDAFFYHYEPQLEALLDSQAPLRLQLKLLPSHVRKSYRSRWEESRTRLSLSLVRRMDLKKLFKPNEPIMAEKHGRKSAFVLDKPVSHGNANNIEFDCWYWCPSRTDM